MALVPHGSLWSSSEDIVAEIEELAIAYVQLLVVLERTPPLTLMNHDAGGAANVIAAVVDRCAKLGAKQKEVAIGVELSKELGLRDGVRLKQGERPVIRVDFGLGRQIAFRRASEAE